MSSQHVLYVAEKIKPLIGNASVATDFVDAVYKRFLEMKTSQLQKSIGTALKRPPEVRQSS